MENLAKPSVLKNHKNSFNSSIKAIREMATSLDNEYNQVADNIATYSKKRESIVHSLENKFNKYNLEYKKPLIQNDVEDIIKYAEELESQLDISLASLDGEKKLKVIDDSLSIPSDITQIRVISEKIEKASEKIDGLEKQVHAFRIPEPDSRNESIFNFNDYAKKLNVNPEEKKEEIEEHTHTIDFSTDLDAGSISSDIFKEDEQDEEELLRFIDEYEQENNSVKVNMNNISSLSDKVEAVYGEKEYIDSIYNFGDNKKVIDERAEELGISPDEAMENRSALNNVVLEFPTELDLYEEDKVKIM